MTDANRLNVLLTSAAAKVTLLTALRSAAKRIHNSAVIIGGDSSSPVVSQYFSDDFWLMPPLSEASTNDIISGLLQRKVSHILPSRDGELLFWAKYKKHLASEGVQVLVADEQSILRCLDKQLFADFLIEKGLPAIATYSNLDTAAHNSAKWVVKERFGAGSQSIGLALDTAAALQHATELKQAVFQPFVAGKELSIDAWLNKAGQLKAHIYRYRIKVQHGESQITQTVALPQYDDIIRDTLQALQLTGPVVLQAIIDNQQQLHIIECNSRFGGASTLGIKAGVDSLYWSLAESCGLDLNAMQFVPAPTPITQVRFAGDLYL
ncbi:ATP-grasp domain-containing protein [Rheinheimera sp. MMS21-TC3]|uniref:ATP-grasp domain-containing protein n=1 Tax=Rheinheimera sp. MMS21-TC3 TaxID=3072790 RepID=UPI0028C48E7F|nr:ATP-grasp domain-containing protein [Rheinheimera sp. MMS21-TC3]WNO61808.1 ATP-grasp domain-containing protein [Rheinheimera sp. MMS21-TC3]